MKTNIIIGLAITLFLSNSALAAGQSERAKRVVKHWTAERMANAVPRDIVVNEKGASFIRNKHGSFVPYGRSDKSIKVAPRRGKPSNGGGSVKEAEWTQGGDVQTAVGRIYFEMPSNNSWGGFICSGTVTQDSTSGRSVIITASHCVYDEATGSFARNVLFIPNQDGTTHTGTDLNCNNDPIGCWAVSFGVVDNNWASNQWPNNIPWDYAYYVVSNTGAHSGNSSASDALDLSTATLGVDFSTPAHDDGNNSSTSIDFTHALGYPGDQDPDFMYCADDNERLDNANWWLGACGMGGGSSGGPWVQPMDVATGSGPIISVNSWGYRGGRSGMAGPMLSGTSAACLFDVARSENFGSVSSADGEAGVVVNCP